MTQFDCTHTVCDILPWRKAFKHGPSARPRLKHSLSDNARSQAKTTKVEAEHAIEALKSSRRRRKKKKKEAYQTFEKATCVGKIRCILAGKVASYARDPKPICTVTFGMCILQS